MTTPDIKLYLSKYIPSTQKLFIHCAIAILCCFAIGFAYSMFVLRTPPDLTPANEALFRRTMGLGFGLYLALIPILVLVIRFFHKLFKAQKLAMEDYMKDLLDKSNKPS